MKKILFIVALSISAFSCSQKSSGNNTAVAGTTYTLNNNVCYNSSNQQVDMAYCTNVTGTAYTYNNGYCYQTGTSTPVPLNYCTSQTTSNGYVYVNGVCYNSTNAQQMPMSYCPTQVTGTGYVVVAGFCYSQTTGQQSPMNYCPASTTGTTTPTSQQCVGQYLYQGYQQVTCNGANCRGYTLQEVSTGRTVTCL